MAVRPPRVVAVVLEQRRRLFEAWPDQRRIRATYAAELNRPRNWITLNLDYINSVFAHNLAKLALARAVGRAGTDLERFLAIR
jgi:hypothetical protein